MKTPAQELDIRIQPILAGLRAVRGLHLRSEWERTYQLLVYERAVREAEEELRDQHPS